MKDIPPDDAPRLLPENTDAWYEVRVGLPRADWKKIRQWIGGQIAEDGRDLAWCQAACDWLRRLGTALGKGYVLHESPIFLMLMSGPDERAEEMLVLLEDERRRISRLLGELSYENYLGKPAAVVLADEDDFCACLADYYPPDHPLAGSGTVFIRSGYGHFVMRAGDPGRLRNEVARATVHNCLMHLPLPRWLGYGLAIALTDSPFYSFTYWRPSAREANFVEAIARFRRKLDAATIQHFWADRPFLESDEDTLSFFRTLAAEMTRKLLRRERFKEFVLKADRRDAGSAAAADVLGLDLGQAVADFLGPGDWKPRPETWESKT
jgi:hypothetical protein